MLRVVFMGTPSFAVPSLVEIVGQGHEVAAVYTRPPRPAGRGMAECGSAVGEAAARFGLPVVTPASLRAPEEAERFASLSADVAVVVAYGLLLPKPILDAPALGCLNVHASLLPRWRGAAPIARAVMAGDEETGVAIMRMQEGLDTGPVCMMERLAIGPDDTAGVVHDALSRLGADLLGRALAALSRGALDCAPQAEGGVIYAAKIDKAAARIDWSRSAREVHNQVRGLAPLPGAWFEAAIGGRPERIRVLKAALADGSGEPGTVLDDGLTVACGPGAVRLLVLQRAGKGALDAAAFLRGVALPAGTRLG